MSKWCRKCALDQPHPLSHWHVRCPACRSFKIFRGPVCGACHKVGQEIMREIMNNDERSNGS